jgi:hypothetical protein
MKRSLAGLLTLFLIINHLTPASREADVRRLFSPGYGSSGFGLSAIPPSPIFTPERVGHSTKWAGYRWLSAMGAVAMGLTGFAWTYSAMAQSSGAGDTGKTSQGKSKGKGNTKKGTAKSNSSSQAAALADLKLKLSTLRRLTIDLTAQLNGIARPLQEAFESYDQKASRPFADLDREVALKLFLSMVYSTDAREGPFKTIHDAANNPLIPTTLAAVEKALSEVEIAHQKASPPAGSDLQTEFDNAKKAAADQISDAPDLKPVSMGMPGSRTVLVTRDTHRYYHIEGSPLGNGQFYILIYEAAKVHETSQGSYLPFSRTIDLLDINQSRGYTIGKSLTRQIILRPNEIGPAQFFQPNEAEMKVFMAQFDIQQAAAEIFSGVPLPAEVSDIFGNDSQSADLAVRPATPANPEKTDKPASVPANPSAKVPDKTPNAKGVKELAQPKTPVPAPAPKPDKPTIEAANTSIEILKKSLSALQKTLDASNTPIKQAVSDAVSGKNLAASAQALTNLAEKLQKGTDDVKTKQAAAETAVKKLQDLGGKAPSSLDSLKRRAGETISKANDKIREIERALALVKPTAKVVAPTLPEPPDPGAAQALPQLGEPGKPSLYRPGFVQGTNGLMVPADTIPTNEVVSQFAQELNTEFAKAQKDSRLDDLTFIRGLDDQEQRSILLVALREVGAALGYEKLQQMLKRVPPMNVQGVLNAYAAPALSPQGALLISNASFKVVALSIKGQSIVVDVYEMNANGTLRRQTTLMIRPKQNLVELHAQQQYPEPNALEGYQKHSNESLVTTPTTLQAAPYLGLGLWLALMPADAWPIAIVSGVWAIGLIASAFLPRATPYAISYFLNSFRRAMRSLPLAFASQRVWESA